MKASMVFLVVSLRATVAIAVATGYDSNVAKLRSGSNDFEPAHAPMPAPAHSKEAFHVDFEITNLNYFDLTKEACPHKPNMVNGKTQEKNDPHPHEKKDVVNDVMGHIDGFSDQISNVFNGAFGKAKGAVKDVKDTVSDSFFQLADDRQGQEKCQTVMELMRETIKKGIQDVIYCSPPPAAIMGIGPSPATVNGASTYDLAIPSGVAPAPAASFLQIQYTERKSSLVNEWTDAQMVSSPAPGPQMAALSSSSNAAVAQDVEVFVTFNPGKPVGAGKATKVDIAFTDKPGGIKAMLAAMPALQLAVNSGMLKQKLSAFIGAAIGIEPHIAKISSGMEMTKLWPIEKCEKHMKDLVGQFGMHYTREQAPRALYNECTNFLTKISFSNDYVLDPLDTKRCKKATAKFTEMWKYGKHVAPEDFQSMCMAACEAKYGKHALQCDTAI